MDDEQVAPSLGQWAKALTNSVGLRVGKNKDDIGGAGYSMQNGIEYKMKNLKNVPEDFDALV